MISLRKKKEERREKKGAGDWLENSWLLEDGRGFVGTRKRRPHSIRGWAPHICNPQSLTATCKPRGPSLRRRPLPCGPRSRKSPLPTLRCLLDRFLFCDTDFGVRNPSNDSWMLSFRFAMILWKDREILWHFFDFCSNLIFLILCKCDKIWYGRSITWEIITC